MTSESDDMDRSIGPAARECREQEAVFRMHLERFLSEADAQGLLMNGDERNVDVFVNCEGDAEIAIFLQLKQRATSAFLKNEDAPADARASGLPGGTLADSVSAKCPGGVLKRFASVVLSERAYRRYVEPHLADMCHEYFEALRRSDRRAATRVVILGYLHSWRPIAAAIVRTIRALLSRSST